MTKLHTTSRIEASPHGFTLIELLIVLAIVGILAGIVVASFGGPASQAREANLAYTLRNLRTQLMNYKIQHNDLAPDGTTLMQQLSQATDKDGNTGVGPAYPLGPYFLSIPANPLNGLSSVKTVAAGTPLIPDNTTGWLYQADSSSFTLIANSSQTDTTGRLLSSY